MVHDANRDIKERNYPLGKARRTLRFLADSRLSHRRKQFGSTFIKADNARSGVRGESESRFMRCMGQILERDIMISTAQRSLLPLRTDRPFH